MSLLGKLKSMLGVGETDSPQISSFSNAGMPADGTTGATTIDIADENQVLPQNVIQDTPPPSFATPPFMPGTGTTSGITFGANEVDANGKPRSQAVSDMLTLGGSGFDDDVYARKMRRQANTPVTQNADYFPGGISFTQAQTAWGDPIFSGAGALFPMAALDANRRAMAQAELQEAADAAINIPVPTVKTGAYVQRFKTGFIDEVRGLTNEYARKYGSPKKGLNAMRADGSLEKLKATYEGLGKSIDETADEATKYLASSKDKAGSLAFNPEGVRSAYEFLTGMNAFANGQISGEQLNKLRSTFKTAERWEDYKDKELKNFKPDEYVPLLQQAEVESTNPSPEDKESFVKQINLPGGYKDIKSFIFIKKLTQANKDKVMSGIVEPFFQNNPLAKEQLVRDGEKIEDAKNRIADSVIAMMGKQVEVGTEQQRPKASTNINVNTGQPTDKTFYQSIDERKGEIMEQAMNIAPSNVPQAKQLAEQIYGGGTADDVIFGVRAFDWPSINKSISSMPYSELYEPSASDFDTRQEVFFGKVNKRNAGIPSENTTAKNLKVQGVINGFVSKGKDGQIRVYSNEDAVKSPLTADYKPYLIQVVTDENFETSGSSFDPNDVGATMEDMKISKKSPATSGIYYRFIPLDKSTATTFDKDADKGSQFTGGTKPVNISVSEQGMEDF